MIYKKFEFFFKKMLKYAKLFLILHPENKRLKLINYSW